MMRQSVARGFFVLAYEHIMVLMPLALLRALPWTALALLISYGPLATEPTVGQLAPFVALAMLALLAAPWTMGAAHLAAVRLGRGEEVELAVSLRGGRSTYVPLLAWTFLETALLLLVVRNTMTYFALAPAGRSFMMHLGLAASFWLWSLSRLWGFLWPPLLVDGPRTAREAARLALLLLVGGPGPLLRRFLLRQALGILLIVSGLGLFFGLGSLLPLHAALSVRAGLRTADLNGEGETDDALEALANRDWRKILRPWE